MEGRGLDPMSCSLDPRMDLLFIGYKGLMWLLTACTEKTKKRRVNVCSVSSDVFHVR